MVMFWTALLKLITAILSVVSGWFAGRASGLNTAKIEELQSYADTSKKIDAVGPVPDADAAIEFLRNRAKH
jgi:carbamate kinase